MTAYKYDHLYIAVYR